MSTTQGSLFNGDAPTWAGRLVTAGLVVASVAALAAWLLLAVGHVDDGYRTDHVSGVRMALAQDAANGVLYPPLYDGERYGGTRYLPLTVVAHGQLGRVVGDLGIAGRLLGYLGVVALVALVVVWLLRAGVPAALAAALAATLLVAEPGLGAAFGMRADGLPAALQLAAIGLVAASTTALTVSAAAVLAALALTAKLTSVWAALAIGVWLLVVSRRLLGMFVTVYVGVCALLFGVFMIVSDGRMLENIVGLAVAGVGGVGVALTAPNRLLHTITRYAPTVWALLPFTVIAAITGHLRERSGLVSLALAAQAPVLLVTFTDVGVGVNQLIDLAGVAAVATGLLAARAGRRTIGGLLVGLVVAWVLGSGAATTTVPEAIDVLGGGTGESAGLAEIIDPDMMILSEDPGVPVRFGQVPVVTDPFMLPRLEHLRPGAVEDLVQRVERQEFDLIILVIPAEGNDGWWTDYHFGAAVIEAVRDRYEPAGEVEGYYLYGPS